MTTDQITKLREALNLIAQIPIDGIYHEGQREQAYSLVKEVVDGAKHNPFAAHWKEGA